MYRRHLLAAAWLLAAWLWGIVACVAVAGAVRVAGDMVDPALAAWLLAIATARPVRARLNRWGAAFGRDIADATLARPRLADAMSDLRRRPPPDWRWPLAEPDGAWPARPLGRAEPAGGMAVRVGRAVLPVAPADATLARRDLVAAYGTTAVIVVTGHPGGGTPAPPPGFRALATIRVRPGRIFVGWGDVTPL